MANIVIVGAGVSGLTTALLLSSNPRYHVTIVAKHVPGDYNIEYTSPWAGAIFLPVSDAAGSRWEKRTWPELARLATSVPEAGIHFQNTVIYNREQDMADADSWMHELHRVDPWFKDLVPDFRVLPAEDLPQGIDSATAFTSVCINTAVYLSYLLSQCIKNGVVVRRGVLKHVSDAAKLHHSREEVDLIVNCTGLLSSKLGGVMDKDVIPVRGQTVLVRNDPGIACTVSGTDDGQDEMCYVIPREAGGGTILGGTYAEGSWESQPCPNTAMRIMKRAVDICPQLTGGRGIEALDIIRHGVGLRPLRLSGVRIEREQIAGTWVVHNYGHGGWGYQGSYGCAQRAVELVDEALGPRR